MHNRNTAIETLELLWHNYLTLLERVDLEAMPIDEYAHHAERRAPVRPFRLAAWLAKQGHIIAAWSLWEYYSRGFIQELPIQVPEKRSTVKWIANALKSNYIPFPDEEWFRNANALRNFIVHNGARVDDSEKADARFKSACTAFPGIEKWEDGYIDITRDHVAELHHKIDCFIRYTPNVPPKKG